MFGIGPLELGIVLVIALLVLGPKKLPELARGLGKGLSEFRRASNDLRRSLDLDVDPHKIEPPPAPAQTSQPHVPPEVGSALEQAEEHAEAAASASLKPEPAPAPPTPPSDSSGAEDMEEDDHETEADQDQPHRPGIR